MVFHVWAHERVPLNLQWLILRIGGAILSQIQHLIGLSIKHLYYLRSYD